jgi:predicted Zn finger-like uncharacterized protein
MIIQCEHCETQFRFDESLIRKDGIWVRCSRCRHEFFQNHPSVSGPAWAGVEMQSDVREIEVDQYPDSPGFFSGSRDREEQEPAGKDEEHEEKNITRVPPRALLTVIYLLASLILLASLGIWFIPDVRLQAMKLLSPYVPAIEGLLGAGQPKLKSVLEEIEIQSVRQRIVTNVQAGSIRVIEGIVMNQSGVPLTRIRVKAELADSADIIVRQMQSYSGNLVTDEELTVMPDEEIQRKLSNLQGSTVSNDRIPPGGQIPFMVVVASEPPGVAKVYVTISGAEHLLQ